MQWRLWETHKDKGSGLVRILGTQFSEGWWQRCWHPGRGVVTEVTRGTQTKREREFDHITDTVDKIRRKDQNMYAGTAD